VLKIHHNSFLSSFYTTIRIWDPVLKKCTDILKGHTDGILDICISTDQKKLVSCGWDKQIIEWDLETKQKTKIYQGHETPVIYNTYFNDGTHLLSLSTDNTFKVWNTDTGICLSTLQSMVNITTELKIDSKNCIYFGCEDGSIRYCDLQRPGIIMQFTGHSALISSIELCEEENTLFSGSADCTVRQWDLKTGGCTFAFAGHLGEIVFIRKIPGQKQILTASRDHTIRVWNIYSGKCVAVLTTNLLINCLTPVQSDGRFAYGTMQGEFKIVKIRGT